LKAFILSNAIVELYCCSSFRYDEPYDVSCVLTEK